MIHLPPEEMSQGSITVGIYIKYFLAGANILVLLLMILIFIVAEVGTDLRMVSHPVSV